MCYIFSDLIMNKRRFGDWDGYQERGPREAASLGSFFVGTEQYTLLFPTILVHIRNTDDNHAN